MTLTLQLISFGQVNLEGFQENDALQLVVSLNGDENTFDVDPVFQFNPILDKYELNEDDKIEFVLNHADRKNVAHVRLDSFNDTGANQEVYLLSDPAKL